jgi:hypothetical protein
VPKNKLNSSHQGHPIDLRKLAAGKECQIRGPQCRHIPFDDEEEIESIDYSDTVLAHVRLSIGGGQKAPDLCGAWACHWCHDWVDGRVHLSNHPFEVKERRRLHLEGVIRTLQEIDQMDFALMGE